MTDPSQSLSVRDGELLAAISDVIGENDDAVRVPMSVLNQDIANLVAENAKVIARVSNVLTRRLTQSVTDSDNDLELIGTVLLSGLHAQVQENDLLLNHLASSAGMIGPGDPLEAALLNQVADAPELAYSATLLIALKEAMPIGWAIVEVLREIRDRLQGEPIAFQGEFPALEEPDAIEATEGAAFGPPEGVAGPW